MRPNDIFKVVGALVSAVLVSIFLSFFLTMFPLFSDNSLFGLSIIGDIAANILFVGAALFFMKAVRVPDGNIVYVLIAGVIFYIVSRFIGLAISQAFGSYMQEASYSVLLVGAIGSALYAWKEGLNTKYIYLATAVLALAPVLKPLLNYY